MLRLGRRRELGRRIEHFPRGADGDVHRTGRRRGLRDPRHGGRSVDRRRSRRSSGIPRPGLVGGGDGDRPVESASLIKPPLHACFLHQAEEGRLTYDDETANLFEKIIRLSDNSLTNEAMEKLGGPEGVMETLQEINDHVGHEIFRDTKIVKYIPPKGESYDGNVAPFNEYLDFMHAVWHGRMRGSDEIKRVMGLPSTSEHRDRLIDGTGIKGYRAIDKTGYTFRMNGNMGILDGPLPYFIGIGIESVEDIRDMFSDSHLQKRGYAQSRIIRGASAAVNKYLVNQYQG